MCTRKLSFFHFHWEIEQYIFPPSAVFFCYGTMGGDTSVKVSSTFEPVAVGSFNDSRLSARLPTYQSTGRSGCCLTSAASLLMSRRCDRQTHRRGRGVTPSWSWVVDFGRVHTLEFATKFAGRSDGVGSRTWSGRMWWISLLVLRIWMFECPAHQFIIIIFWVGNCPFISQ